MAGSLCLCVGTIYGLSILNAGSDIGWVYVIRIGWLVCLPRRYSNRARRRCRLSIPHKGKHITWLRFSCGIDR
jgi:hypothetical protein